MKFQFLTPEQDHGTPGWESKGTMSCLCPLCIVHMVGEWTSSGTDLSLHHQKAEGVFVSQFSPGIFGSWDPCLTLCSWLWPKTRDNAKGEGPWHPIHVVVAQTIHSGFPNLGRLRDEHNQWWGRSGTLTHWALFSQWHIWKSIKNEPQRFMTGRNRFWRKDNLCILFWNTAKLEVLGNSSFVSWETWMRYCKAWGSGVLLYCPL
jgi:hypothetical protein